MSARRMNGLRAAAAVIAAAAIVAVAAPAHALNIKRMKLSDGAILLVSEQHRLPMVTLSIAFDAGARRDPVGKEGLAELTAESLAQGTKTLTANEFNQKVDFMGSSIGVAAGRDYATAGFTSLKKYEGATLKLLAGILAEPGLRDADIERKRAEQVAGIKAAQEQPGYVADVAFDKALFGADSPYGHPTEGYADSAAKLTPGEVRTFYREHYRMGDAVIAVAGDVTAAEIKAALEKELAALPGGAPAPEAVPAAPAIAPGLHPKLIDRNVEQANIALGFGGIDRANPDYYRLQVMNYILGGGGFASRLMKIVRTKEGLAYSINSGFDAGKFPGSFSVVLQTKNRSANQALELILQQLRKIQEQPVTDAELQSAKKFLVGSFPLKYDRLSSIASFMQQVELYGLGLDYAGKYPSLIQSVTKEGVLNVAKKYLHPGSILLVAVANQKEAKIDTAKLAHLVAGAASN
ncbi:MAG: M16 family metallopeptidase [Candidatus Binataceae bacterium]